ncbi:ABC transporter ATP-binding protein [Candidatus Bipolaricaulota bacterium]|nr:ABC transporter ATP-binding protein [Candidatus Bipolaricaulota bacterium]
MLAQLRGIVKTYGAVEALRGVDLELRPGEIVGLLGPNGSGKTTLLKVIAGLLLPDRGGVTVLGGSPRRCRGAVAYLPELPYLPGWMRTAQVETLFRRIFPGFRVDSFRELIGVLRVPDRPVRGLSKGERGRLELAAILALNAKLYLLDEPLGGLDPVSRDRILQSVIAAWHKEAGFVIATHLVAEAEPLFDRVVFLREGKVVLDAPAEELREKGKSVRDVYLEVFGDVGLPVA